MFPGIWNGWAGIWYSWVSISSHWFYSIQKVNIEFIIWHLMGNSPLCCPALKGGQRSVSIGDQYQIQKSAREGLHLPLSFNLTCSLKKRLLVLDCSKKCVCVCVLFGPWFKGWCWMTMASPSRGHICADTKAQLCWPQHCWRRITIVWQCNRGRLDDRGGS